ncbi:acyltransferase domain-containing protein, partial [bacterium]|nr:acyltransferase domain-containing protein [bacterium]
MDLELEKKYKETLKKASERIKALTAENETLRQAEPIAVIGMGCRFPGEVFTPQEFWQLLCNGGDTVTDIPADRWDVDAYYDPDRDAPGRMYTKQGAFLSGVDRFDPAFFGITPKEAESLDPQQRILLEVSWEMFEHAGLNPSQLRGSRTGVFIGQTNYDYIQAHIHSGDVERITPYAGSGVMFSTTAGRLSYFYDLQGPCLTVDTACSSSLVSLDLALKHLQKNECDCAMAGGVNLLLSLDSYISMCKVNALSPDGRCHAFDNQAQGYGRGEGCGLVLLKRLSDAMRDGDRVLSVIRGSAVNHDGRSNGLTAPNGPSQQRVIQQALADANLQPADVDYVEAHGTGTILGDPIEVHALDAVYGKAHDASHPLYIGSVKTNIGHTEASAGIAGIMKVVLSLQNKKIPPSLHFNTPNQHIAFDQIPIQVTTQVRNWESVDKKRVAAVSSFGLSGTNAHIILEEPPKPQELQTSDDPRDYHLLKVTAQSKQAAKELATRYHDAIANNPQADWLDFCYSANTGRQDLPARLVVGAGNQDECLSALRAYAHEQKSQHNFIPKQKMTSHNVAFLFTGQGAMYSGMGKTLYHHHPVFKQNLDRCADILAQYWDESLIDRLYQGDEARLCETEITQPALVAFEYALFKVWEEWGITPTAVLGHSIGEYTAAIVAGVMSLESALKLAVERGRRMQALPAGGAMAAVFAAEEAVNPLLAPYQGKIAIAAYNAPERLTLSGDADAMRELIDTLRAENLEIRPLSVSHAFHSHHMHPMMAAAEQFGEQEKRSAPTIPFYSTLTGTRIDAKQLISRRYWAKQIIQPVLFTQAVKTMREDGYSIFLELGPTETLSLFARQTCGDGLFLSSLKKGVNDWKRMYGSAAQLYVHGLALNWQAVESPFPHKRIDVPTYPFQRKRYWLDLCPTRHKNKEKSQQAPAMDIREENQTRQNKDNVAMPTQKESRMDVRQILLNELTQKLAEVGGFDPQDIAADDVLMELGLDSLMLVKMGQEVEKRFHVELTMRQFFQEIQSLNHLADYLMQHGDLSAITIAKSAETEPIGTNQTQTGTTPSHVTSNSSLPTPEMKEQPQSIMQLMQQQLQLMEQVTTQNRQAVEKLIQDQLAVLQSNKNDISPTS